MKRKLSKGNYELEQASEMEVIDPGDFEEAALKKLGGSIAFVRRKKK